MRWYNRSPNIIPILKLFVLNILIQKLVDLVDSNGAFDFTKLVDADIKTV